MIDDSRQKNARILDNRKGRILRFVVEQFISTGDPVGSRTLSKMEDEHLSPASIRNTMADLEELGYLFQPHISAGRVPTDKGYRYYVDTLMEPLSLKLAEQKEINSFFNSFSGVMGTMLENASKLISRYSHYIGIVSTPLFESVVFKYIQFIRQSAGRILVIFVTKSGIVYNKLIEVQKDYTQEELDQASRWVDDNFKNLTLHTVRKKVKEMLQEDRAKADELTRRALMFSHISFKDGFGDIGLYVEGTTNIITDPEFTYSGEIEELLEAIEQKSRLIDLISSCFDKTRVQVVIGSEAELCGIKGCSLVAGAYCFPDGSRGSVAVLGPTRMPYPRTMFLVDYISKRISTIAD